MVFTFKQFCLVFLCAMFGAECGIEYTVYLESWDAQYALAYQGVVTNSQSQYKNYDGVTVNLSFGAFQFTPAEGFPTNASGLYGTAFGGSYGGQDAAIGTIIDYVRNHGSGKVLISYGGNSYAYPYAPNYFISQTQGWPGNIATLASGVANAVLALGLDGVDFDIEDPLPAGESANEFASYLISFLEQVRALLGSDKTITVTIPGQGWGQYWQYLAQGVAAIPGLVNGINFMEYDIWINSALPNGYVGQVEADILTYTSPTSTAPAPNWAQGWGIDPSLIQLGLMPGYDDLQHLMTASMCQELTEYALTMGLPGVFIWDIDRDAMTTQTPVPFYPSTPYAYSNAIRASLLEEAILPVHYSERPRSKRCVNYESTFIQQNSPNMGKPPYFSR